MLEIFKGKAWIEISALFEKKRHEKSTPPAKPDKEEF